MKNRRMKTSGDIKMRSGLRSLRCGGNVFASRELSSRLRGMSGISGRYQTGGRMLPLPTRLRRVSGMNLRHGQHLPPHMHTPSTNKAMMMAHIEDAMHRNQKIDLILGSAFKAEVEVSLSCYLQPSPCVRPPPITGPSVGPTEGANISTPVKTPRSCLVMMSPMTPDAIRM